MDLPATARPKSPYGLAFAVQDLVQVRAWAAGQGLGMQVLLDQVLDGAEFEELLLIARPGRGRRALSVWRTSAGIIAQASSGQPLLFSTMKAVTDYYANLFNGTAVSPRRPFWRQLLLR
jgi:hypothetical protein